MIISPIPCLLGPTASGKSVVAAELAGRMRGEVINCDAFSVYRDMPILTAAPEADGEVVHHLVGVQAPTAPWSAALFVEAADRLVEEIRSRGRQPFLVGGTALYLRTWLKGLGAPVPRDQAYRDRLRQRAREDGPTALHDELLRVDPDRAAALHPHDLRRVVRALEIVRATGRPASAQRREWSGPDRQPALLVGLARTPQDLARRIDVRVDAMFEAGVVEEARRLLARPLCPEAAKVLGLDVLGALLEARLDEAQAREVIARRTRRFARKQMTFFRSFENVRWIDVGPGEGPSEVARRATALLPSQTQRGVTSE